MLRNEEKIENTQPALQTTDYWKLIQDAKRLADDRQFEKALEIYHYLCNERPDLPSALYYRAQAYEALSTIENNREYAIADYTAATKALNPHRDPTKDLNTESHLLLAQAHEALAKLKEMGTTDDTIATKPEDRRGYEDRKAAIDAYSKIIALTPQNANAFSKRAILHKKLNNEAEFSNDMQSAKKYRADEIHFRKWYHIQLCCVLRNLKNADFSRNSFPLLTGTPDIQDAKLTNNASEFAFLGHQAFEEKKFDIAISQLGHAIVRFPDDCISKTYMALSLYCTGKKEEAFKEITLVVNNYNYARGYWARGIMHHNNKNDALAKRDFMASIRLSDESDYEILDLNESIILRLINNTDDAPEQKPDFTLREGIQQGLIKLAEEKYDDAIQVFAHTLRFYPKESSIYHQMGLAYFKKEDYEKSHLYYSMALWLGKNKNHIVEYYFHRAILNIRTDIMHRAKADIKSAEEYIKDMPQPQANELTSSYNAIIYLELITKSRLALENDNLEKAVKYFNSAIAINPDKQFYITFSNACAAKARQAAENGSLNRADAFYQEAISKNPNDVELHIEHGHVLGKLKLYPSAYAARDRAIELNLDNPKLNRKIKYLEDSLSISCERDKRTVKIISREATKLTTTQPAEAPTSHTVEPQKTKKSKQKIQKKSAAINMPKRKKSAAQKLVVKPDDNTPVIHIESDNIALALAEEKAIKEKERKEKAKEREKQKKAEKIKLRHEKQSPADTATLVQDQKMQNETKPEPSMTAHNTSTTYMINQLSAPATISTVQQRQTDNITIPLTNIERTVFSQFEEYSKTSAMKYKLLNMSESLYGRIREQLDENNPCPTPHLFHFVTEAPTDDIIAVMKEIEKSEKVNQIAMLDGKFKMDLDNNISILLEHYSTLHPLVNHAQTRSFREFYCDASGKIFDPSGFAMTDLLQKNKIRTYLSVGEAIKLNPTVLLEAIYRSTKYSATILNPFQQQLKDELKKDKQYLGNLFNSVPPDKLNDSLCFVLSEGMASKNYAKLCELNLISVLFPTISHHLQQDHAWLLEQMQITDKFPRPLVQRIYSSFIISAVMQQLRQNQQPDTLMAIFDLSREMILGSVWLNQAFSTCSDLSSYLTPAIRNWRLSHPRQQNENTLSIQEAPRMAFGRN